MVAVIGCASGDECQARQEHCSRRVWLGLGNAVPLGRVDMSFIVAGGVLLLALLTGIVLDGIGITSGSKRDVTSRPFDAW
jgi:hypothetical protein